MAAKLTARATNPTAPIDNQRIQASKSQPEEARATTGSSGSLSASDKLGRWYFVRRTGGFGGRGKSAASYAFLATGSVKQTSAWARRFIPSVTCSGCASR